MRVIVLIRATADSEAGIRPSAELMKAIMGNYNEELAKAGITVESSYRFGHSRPYNTSRRGSLVKPRYRTSAYPKSRFTYSNGCSTFALIGVFRLSPSLIWYGLRALVGEVPKVAGQRLSSRAWESFTPPRAVLQCGTLHSHLMCVADDGPSADEDLPRGTRMLVLDRAMEGEVTVVGASRSMDDARVAHERGIGRDCDAI